MPFWSFLAARLRQDPLGSLQRSPRTPNCIETPRAFGTWSSAGASSHTFGVRRQSVLVIFFPFEHCKTETETTTLTSSLKASRDHDLSLENYITDVISTITIGKYSHIYTVIKDWSAHVHLRYCIQTTAKKHAFHCHRKTIQLVMLNLLLLIY